jgi:hypothetical protein
MQVVIINIYVTRVYMHDYLGLVYYTLNKSAVNCLIRGEVESFSRRK